MKSGAARAQAVDVARQDAAVDAAWKGYERSREEWGRRRLALGEALVAVRGRWPRSGPKARGWGEYLAARGIDQDVALDAMAYAGYLEENPPAVPGNLPGRREAGLEGKPAAGSPAPREVSVSDLFDLLERMSPSLDPEDRALARKLLKPARDETDGSDHDAWCTPPEITSALPEVDLDPCSNERSTVRARRQCWLSRGEDGLKVPWRGSLWINGPFSDLEPWAVKLVEEWPRITACGWLCNTDSTTEWWRLCVSVLPLRLDLNDRTPFVPPPGVKASSNDRAQTLLMTDSFWRGCDQAALLRLGTLWRRSGALGLVR